MRPLKAVLAIAGVVCLVSVLGLVLPLSALQSLTTAFTGEELPEGPVFVYGLRAISATYAAIGVYLLILARDPARYGVLVPFTGVAAVVIGIVCGVVGAAVRLKPVWFVGDFLGLVVFGLLILILWGRIPGPEAPEPQAPPVRET
jgi:hypothetical protein